MGQPITDLEQATPEWLTDVLQKRGVLPQGRVSAIDKKPLHEVLTSQIACLEARYSSNAPASAPVRLFLKFARSDARAEVFSACGKNEVAFYTTVADAMTDLPMVRCYDTVYAAETSKYHVLLDDLSDSHSQPEWPVPPPQQHCEQAIACLAKVHALWWEHTRLEKDIGQVPTEETFKAGIAETNKKVRDFVDFLGDRLSEERRRIYKTLLTLLPRFWEHHRWHRLIARNACTLLHGDAHLWSFLYPHDPNTDTVRIIDWQFWHLGVGTDDLAYMIALHWYPDRRQILEQDLLKRYHDELLQYGVANYTWDQCWLDYRVSAMRNLLTPALQWSVKIPAAAWWSHLERAMSAFLDLSCNELLEH